VFKNYPLTAHPLAPAAGAAAECAGEQGQFWEMHHLLYEAQEQWLVDDPDPELTSLAGQLGLDSSAFAACLAGRDALERVLADRFEVEGIVSLTPSFVFIYGGAGRQMEGTRDADDFIAILETQLEGALAAQAETG
jgi:protein-disulfide isomerase